MTRALSALRSTDLKYSCDARLTTTGVVSARRRVLRGSALWLPQNWDRLRPQLGARCVAGLRARACRSRAIWRETAGTAWRQKVRGSRKVKQVAGWAAAILGRRWLEMVPVEGPYSGACRHWQAPAKKEGGLGRLLFCIAAAPGGAAAVFSASGRGSLLKRQLHGRQVAAGFHQHQRAFVQHYRRWALAWHADGLRLGGNRSLHSSDLVHVGVDPLQARCGSHLLQLVDGQCERLDAGQTVRSGYHRCDGCRSGCRCCNRGWCRHRCWRGRHRGCYRRGDRCSNGGRCVGRGGHGCCHRRWSGCRCRWLRCRGREVAAAWRFVLRGCWLGLRGVEIQHRRCGGLSIAVVVTRTAFATLAAVTAVAVARTALAALFFCSGTIAVGLSVVAGQVQIGQASQWRRVGKVARHCGSGRFLGFHRAGCALATFATVAAITTFTAWAAFATGLLGGLAFCAVAGVASVGAFHLCGHVGVVITVQACVLVARLGVVAAATATSFTPFASIAATVAALAFAGLA